MSRARDQLGIKNRRLVRDSAQEVNRCAWRLPVSQSRDLPPQVPAQVGKRCAVLMDQISCRSNPLIGWLCQMEVLKTAASLHGPIRVEGSVWLCSCIPPEN